MSWPILYFSGVKEQLQVLMMRDLSAVGEEWAEAAEWLEHFVTDHTDSQRVHRQLKTTLLRHQTKQTANEYTKDNSIETSDHIDSRRVHRQHY